MKANEPTLV